MTGGAVRLAVRPALPSLVGGAQDAAGRRRRGRHGGHLRHADGGGAAGRRAAALRVEAAQLHPGGGRRGRRGGGARAAARRRADLPGRRPCRPGGRDARLRRRRRTAGRSGVGAAHRSRLRLRGPLRQAADPLDVVADPRRPGGRHRRPASTRACWASATTPSRICSPDISRRLGCVAAPRSKPLVWAVALGSGTSGGVLAPLLIMGGASGSVGSSADSGRRRRAVGHGQHGGDDGRHDALAADGDPLHRRAHARLERAAGAAGRRGRGARRDRAAAAALDPHREARPARPPPGARVQRRSFRGPPRRRGHGPRRRDHPGDDDGGRAVRPHRRRRPGADAAARVSPSSTREASWRGSSRAAI